MHLSRYATLAVTFTALLAGGCHSHSLHPSVTYSQIDPTTAGNVQGTITLDKPAPKRVAIDMAQDPACSMAGGTNLSEQFVVNDGKLANVYVYIKNGLGDKIYAAPAQPVILDQKGCRYVPHVIAAQVGQPVEFRNSDATMHNVHMEPTVGGNQAVDISQPPNGGTTQHIFARTETMIPVRCNNHPWMQAYINVAPSPFFAVSDQDGHFTISGLPPGTYSIVALHEQLGIREMRVNIFKHATSTANMHF